jgi:tetratricopeptide (TPR) repeat protein
MIFYGTSINLYKSNYYLCKIFNYSCMAMWEGTRENSESKEFAGVVKRYKKMLSDDQMGFFDVSDFEYIVDHYIDKNQLTNALQASEIAISQHPHSMVVKIKKAQVLLGQLKIEKALELLKMLADIESTNPEILLMLGNCYSIQGDEGKAYDYYRKADKYSFEDRDELLYDIGVGYVQNGDYQRAVFFLEKAYDENPKNDNVLYDLAFSYDKLENDEKSIRYYNEYLDIYPFAESAWYNLGIIYTRLEEYDKAIEAYDFALAIDENYASALFNKANTLSTAEKYSEALTCYLEYLRFDENSSDAHVYIAECYFQLEEYSKSYHYYKQAIKLDPKNADGWYGAGIVLMVEENLAESLVFFKKALKLDDSCADFWNAFGKANAALNHYEEALVSFKKSVEIENTNPDFWISYADFYYNYNQIGLAIQTMFEAEMTVPENAPMLYKLSGYLTENGDFQLARIYLKKALTLNFSIYPDFFLDFPGLQSKRWIKKLIGLFSMNNNLW